MIELDGSFGEGGGQILRSSLALSLLTGKAFHLARVRAGRAKPGLQPQHRMSVRAAATIGQATVRGDVLGSTDLVFEPGEVVPGKYTFSIGTAGATGLVLHTIYLPLTLAVKEPSTVVLQGGTHVRTSPIFPFLETTWRAYLQRLGMTVKLRLIRPGFYPRGGGVLEAHLQPCDRLRGFRGLTQPATQITGVSAVAGLPEKIAQRQARRASVRLQDLGLPVEIREETWTGGPGTVLTLVLNTAPVPTLFYGLGERGKPAERVADEAVDQVETFVSGGGAAVDAHSADQMVLPLALADEPSEFRVAEVTSHLLTNIAVIRQFVDRAIACDGTQGQTGVVRIGEV